jgi:hypothetical protein
MSIYDSLTQEPAVSEPAEIRQEIKAIASVIQTYIEGGKKGDAAIMKRAFRGNATIHGYLDGHLIAGSIQNLYDWVTGNPPATDLEARIVKVDVAETVATTRVELTNWLGHCFTDQFTLFKENDKWIITSKVFHTY